jgi:hypothetical protein
MMSLVRYIKLFDVGEQLMTNRVRGCVTCDVCDETQTQSHASSYVPCKLVFFLMNMHILPRDIFLCRTGQSEYK